MTAMANGAPATGTGDAIADIVEADGGASHRHVLRLASAEASNAMLADAVHFLCVLHGRYPGVIDHAADRITDDPTRGWMYSAAAGFAAERAYLTRLVVAIGPVPSTPGQVQSDAAVQAQVNALAVLALSERRGTALGAALALAADWACVRSVLDRAARRSGLQPPPNDLPGPSDGALVLAAASETPAAERALLFGARQLLAQHRGLWDLLESREAARAG